PPTVDSIETTRDGDTVTLEVFASDPGTDDTLTYQFDCDNNGDFETDGNGNQGACTLDPGAAVTTIVVRVMDDDQGATTGSVSIQQSVMLCVNRYTGEVGVPLHNGNCPGVERSLVLPAADPVTLCINQYTGGVTWLSSQTCSPAQRPHVTPADGPLPYCVNRYTGTIRVPYKPQACTSQEDAGVIPG